MNKITHYMSGENFDGQSQHQANIYDPSTGKISATVSLATNADVDVIVEASNAAWPSWSKMPVLRRVRILDRFKSILWERMDALATTISKEHGKTFEDAKGEVTRGLEVVEFAVGMPHLLKGEFSENVGTGVDSQMIRQSLGVVAGITPFNFPVMVPMWMFPIALATGNCFILKPSERDPSAALMIASWLTEAGLPNDVFNVVQGDKIAVDALLEHPKVKAISFVGSTPIASYIHETATRNRKRVQALGGAKNHMIVMPDADLDMAAKALMGAAFGSAGERCMAISVVVPVGEKVAKALIDKLVPMIESLKIGAPLNDGVEMGPLVTQQHLDKVTGYIDQGVAQGATLVVDGRNFKSTELGHENGYFMGGTLFDNVTTDMSIYLDEIFGPVLTMVHAKTYSDAVNIIHGHEYANGCSIFTRDGDTARKFSQDIEVGMVGVNVPIPVPMAFHSFGGWKSSMFGDHHMHGMEGVRFYTRLKTTTLRWPTGQYGSSEFAMPILG